MVDFLKKITLIFVSFLSLQALAEEPPQESVPNPIPPVVTCLSKDRHISVVTTFGLLALCDQGKVSKTYRVALGSGGIDKRLEGDRKTPLGMYLVGEPKPSERFKTFIPVGYPTKIQRKAGYTGGAIGIHGPDREYEFLGEITVLINWTAGCIAVGYDLEIDEIKDWVNERHPKFIQILK